MDVLGIKPWAGIWCLMTCRSLREVRRSLVDDMIDLKSGLMVGFVNGFGDMDCFAAGCRALLGVDDSKGSGIAYVMVHHCAGIVDLR